MKATDIVTEDQLVELLKRGYVVVPIRCVSPQGVESALRPGTRDAEVEPASEFPRGLLVHAASDAFGLTNAQIRSPGSARRVARPRQYAMHFGWTRVGYSMPELGRMFGNRDHTTALYAVRKVEELLADPETAWEAAAALQRLEDAYLRAMAIRTLPRDTAA